MKPIYLKLSKPTSQLPICSSHFWGNPDLPADTAYPTYTGNEGEECPYTFICQINLADVASLDHEGILPHKGLLAFFAKIDYYLGNLDTPPGISGYISSTDDVKVLYFPDTDGTFQKAIRIDQEDAPAHPKALQISFTHNREPYGSEHALLAPPDHREWETWDPPYEDWQILLQIDSDEDDDFHLNFTDWGVLDFLIAPDDLRHHCFDRVRAIVLST